MVGHLVELALASPPDSDCPGQRRGRGVGQMVGEVEARLTRGVLVVERLHGVAAALNLRAQSRSLLAHWVSAVPPVHLDLEQGDVLAPDGNADRCAVD